MSFLLLDDRVPEVLSADSLRYILPLSILMEVLVLLNEVVGS